MRVIAGQLKGRKIPFINRRFGNARVTSERVKEAVFSMLGTELPGRSFLDLFAGSGQMGLEAFSRGCITVMNEPDRRRYGFISGLLDELDLRSQIVLHRLPAKRLVRVLGDGGDRFDVIYLDPPYHEQVEGEPMAQWALESVASATLLRPGGVVAVQHDSRLDLLGVAGDLAVLREKRYGDTSITLYGHLLPVAGR
jgi:16S rRNA (guanine966-N2)-methyltransferase